MKLMFAQHEIGFELPFHGVKKISYMRQKFSVIVFTCRLQWTLTEIIKV